MWLQLKQGEPVAVQIAHNVPTGLKKHNKILFLISVVFFSLEW